MSPRFIGCAGFRGKLQHHWKEESAIRGANEHVDEGKGGQVQGRRIDNMHTALPQNNIFLRGGKEINGPEVSQWSVKLWHKDTPFTKSTQPHAQTLAWTSWNEVISEPQITLCFAFHLLKRRCDICNHMALVGKEVLSVLCAGKRGATADSEREYAGEWREQ